MDVNELLCRYKQADIILDIFPKVKLFFKN